MSTLRCLVLMLAMICGTCLAHSHVSKASPGYEYVTCGSVVKLTHIPTAAKLHSHEVKYGSGSGQQSVTALPQEDDTNSYWTVRGAHGKYCERGTPIKCGSLLRLQHLNTKRNLHSHNFQSPLSGLVEVSAFGENGSGDSGDNWKVECNGSHWMRNTEVRFRHVETNQYLHCSGRHTFGRPIQGQFEVAGFARPNSDNVWRAEEGIYVKYEVESKDASEEDDE